MIDFFVFVAERAAELDSRQPSGRFITLYRRFSF